MNNEAQEIQLQALPPAAPGEGHPLLTATQALPFLGGLKVRLSARLGGAEITVADLTSLQTGATLALDRPLDQPIELLAEGHVVALGTLVAIGDHFGVRITAKPSLA